MRSMTRALRCAALALLAVLALTGSAGADSATISPGGRFTMVSSGRVTYDSSTVDITCNETVTGTYFTDIEEVESSEAKIGTVDELATANCSGASSVVLLEGPVDVEWERSLGVWPELLTGILVSHLVEEIEFNGVFGFTDCLYRGTVGELYSIRGANPYDLVRITRLGTVYNLVTGGFGCPPTITKGAIYTGTPQDIFVN